MNTQLSNRAWDTKGVSPQEKLILVYLAYHADPAGRFTCEPQRMVRDCGINCKVTHTATAIRVADQIITRLVSLGLLERDGFDYRVFPNRLAER